MAPLGSGFAGRQTDAAWADQGSFEPRSFDLARHIRGAAEMIDERGMADGALDGIERGLFQNGSVQGSPADVLAMGNETVLGSKGPPVGFASRKNRIGRDDHGSWWAIGPIVYQGAGYRLQRSRNWNNSLYLSWFKYTSTIVTPLTEFPAKIPRELCVVM